jgi:hypothetical protein
MVLADRRVHGTTREMPLVRFERDEAQRLRPLAVRQRSLREDRFRHRCL